MCGGECVFVEREREREKEGELVRRKVSERLN